MRACSRHSRCCAKGSTCSDGYSSSESVSDAGRYRVHQFVCGQRQLPSFDGKVAAASVEVEVRACVAEREDKPSVCLQRKRGAQVVIHGTRAFVLHIFPSEGCPDAFLVGVVVDVEATVGRQGQGKAGREGEKEGILLVASHPPLRRVQLQGRT